MKFGPGNFTTVVMYSFSDKKNAKSGNTDIFPCRDVA